MSNPDPPGDKRKSNTVLGWVRGHVPPGLRLVLGVLCIIGGILGALPVLGFWMIPLGIAIAGLDVKPLCRKLKNRRTRTCSVKPPGPPDS